MQKAISAAVVAFVAAAIPVVAAQDWPTRPLTVVVPFAPGGGVDILGRVLAQEYQARSKQPTNVENRSGGAGNIGMEVFRRAAPDGSMLLVVPAGNLTINPSLMPDLPYDVERDFAPIATLGATPNVFVVSPKLGIKTIAELIARAKQKTMTYGSPSVGTQLHLAMELFNRKAGVEITHVPYRGTQPALTDLLGGHIDVLASNLSVVLPFINDGRVIPLAMTSSQRSDLTPNVPTLAEAGIPDIDVTSWYGLLGPKAMSKPTIDSIFSVTSDIMKSPGLQEKLKRQAVSVMIESPDVFAERIRRELAIWRELIKERKITAH
jgi:tripartite-type tricarboxylate transporter receptor subunit TctC